MDFELIDIYCPHCGKLNEQRLKGGKVFCMECLMDMMSQSEPTAVEIKCTCGSAKCGFSWHAPYCDLSINIPPPESTSDYVGCVTKSKVYKCKACDKSLMLEHGIIANSYTDLNGQFTCSDCMKALEHGITEEMIKENL